MNESEIKKIQEYVVKRRVGKLPVLIGDYEDGRVYSMLNRVLIYGCEMESKEDNNDSVPATLNELGTQVIFNTEKWKIISDGSVAWLERQRLAQIESDIETLSENKVDKVEGKQLSTNDYTSEEKIKLGGIASGAEVNQNAFSKVKVGDATVEASNKTDTLTINAGSNAILGLDIENKEITISAIDTTYSAATTSSAGLMSASDKKKLDSIAEKAEVNVQADWNEVDTSSDAYIKNKPNVYIKPEGGISDEDMAQDVKDSLGKADTAYQKPSTGIPKTDLEQSVQNSLSKADTALQSFTESDPTVPAWAKASTKPSYTKSEVGLGNVTNDAQVKRSEMGVANGVATLDDSGKVPSSQLPAYVDDVLEYDTRNSFPATGQADTIYIAIDTALAYRWTGTTYAEISPSIALGETSSTAYAGDKGKALAEKLDDIAEEATKTTAASRNGYISVNGTEEAVYTHPSYTEKTSGLYKVTVDSEGHVSAATAVQKSDITALGIPSENTTYAAATTSANGLMTSTDKSKLDGIESGAQKHIAPTATEVKTALGTSSSGTEKYLREDGTWQKPPTGEGADGNTTYKLTIGSETKGDSDGVDLGTLKSEAAVNEGTTLSLVTTGEKAIWNSKQGALTIDDVFKDDSTNPVQNKVLKEFLDSLVARVEALEKASPAEDIDYAQILTDLISTYDSTLTELGLPTISSTSSLKSYLVDEYYTPAKTAFAATSSPLFADSTYPEADYVKDVEGVRGSNENEREKTFKAMASWLFAMCLSELMPSENTDNTLTNNQTSFFSTAWDFADGNTTGLYGGYTVHADPMIGRIAAGAVYATIRGKKAFSDIQTIRTAINNAKGSTVASAIPGEIFGNEDASDIVENKLGFIGARGSIPTQVGWLVNSAKVIPVAPGPFAETLNTRDVPYGDNKQSEDLFYTSNDSTRNWLEHNYKVDVAIDKAITTNYNMTSNDKNIRSRIVYGAAMSWATIPAFYGSLTLENRGENEGDEKCVDGVYFFNYTTKSDSDDNVYKITGPFASYQDKIFKSFASANANATITSTGIFLGNIAGIADDCRFPTFHPEYGRRRPLGGLTIDSARVQDSTKTEAENRSNPLNGIAIGDVVSKFANTSAQYNNWGNHNVKEYDYPHDKPTSYPSGHTAQAFTIALMLGQMRASKVSGYSEIADLIKNAYNLSVSRSINRFHWNSDLIYGRLFSTMILPLINAMSGIQTLYDNAKAIINGESVDTGSVDVTYDSVYDGGGSSTDNITIIVHNNSGDSLIFENIEFAFDVTDAYGSDSTGGFDIGGSLGNGESITLSDLSLNDYKKNKIGNTLTNPRLRINNVWTDCVAFSSGTFVGGATYNVYYGGSTPSTVTGGGSGSVSTTDIKVVFKNNSSSSVSFVKQANFLVDVNGTVTKTGRAKNGTDPDTLVTVAAGGSTEFRAIVSAEDYPTVQGKAFSTTYIEGEEADDYGSNVILYDSDGTSINQKGTTLPHIENSGDVATKGFQAGATYTINYGGGSTPTPTPTPTTGWATYTTKSQDEGSGSNSVITLVVSNNLSRDVTIDELGFLFGGRTHTGEGKYYNYYAVSHIPCSITLSAGEQNREINVDLSTSLGWADFFYDGSTYFATESTVGSPCDYCSSVAYYSSGISYCMDSLPANTKFGGNGVYRTEISQEKVWK